MGFASGFTAGYNAVADSRDAKAKREREEQEKRLREIQIKEAEERANDASTVRGLRKELDDRMRGVDPYGQGGSKFVGPLTDAQAAAVGQMPEPRDTLGLRMRLASASGQDLTPYLEEQKKYRREDVFKTRGKEFDSLDKQAIAQWMEKHSMNSDIPMYGTPEKNGKYTVFVQGRPSVSLSRADMRHMYVAEALMDTDPEEAFRVMSAGSDKLRSLAKDLAGFQVQAAQLNNTAAHQAATDQYHQDTLGVQRARLGIERQNSERANWMPEQYVDKDGNVRVFDVNRKSPGKPQFVERQMPEGLKPYNPRPPAELKVNSDGSVTRGAELFVPDPKRPGAYMPATGFGPTALDTALANYMRGNDGRPSARETTPGFRPMTRSERTDVTRRPEFVVGNPANFQRVSKRGLLGGVNYEYLDPATGQRFSVEEYNRIIAGD